MGAGGGNDYREQENGSKTPGILRVLTVLELCSDYMAVFHLWDSFSGTHMTCGLYFSHRIIEMTVCVNVFGSVFIHGTWELGCMLAMFYVQVP